MRLFLPLIGRQAGDFLHFPFPGAYMEQPAATMRILEAIQGEYHKYLAEVNRIPGA